MKYLLFLITISVSTLLAGQAATLSGTVTDGSNTSLPYANVLLLSATDSTLVRGDLTDENGAYSLPVNEPGEYLVRAELIGFNHQYSERYIYVAGEEKTLASLVLTAGVELDAVTIRADKPLIELRADKMVVNVSNSSINAGNSALEILRKAPGVALDNDNNISLRGREGVLVTINGKQQYLSGQDIARLLETMPASGIKEIEIITNPSAKYDAEGNSGIINIVLSKNENYGTNGSISSTLRKGIKASHFHNANVNHRSGKLSLLGAVEWYNYVDYRRLNLIRNIPSDEGITNFDQVAVITNDGKGSNLRLVADYEISERTTLGIMARRNASNREQNNDNLTEISGVQDLGFNRLNVVSIGDEDRGSNTYNFNFAHRAPEHGLTFDFDADYNTFRQEYLLNYETNYLTAAGQKTDGPVFLRNFQDIAVDIFATKADAGWEISDRLNLEGGLKFSDVRTVNATVFEELDGNEWVNQPDRTNTFDYRESVMAAYLNTNFTLGIFSGQGGLRLERTASEGISETLEQTVTRTYTNLFPSLSISHAVAAEHQLSYSYSYRLDRPNYNNLNPFEFYLDDFTRGAGNPFLNPQYSHTLGVNYAWENKLYVSANYSHTTDQISGVIEQRSEENLSISTTANLDNFTNVSLTVSVPKVWSEIWTSRLNYTGFYNEFTSSVQAGFLDDSSLSHRFFLSNAFKFSQGWTAEVNANYSGRAVYGFFTVDPRGGLDLGLTKKIGKSFSVKLGATDIFRTQPSPARVKLGEVDLIDDSIFDSRRVSLTLTWNFGNQKVKGTRKRETAGAQEQGRL